MDAFSSPGETRFDSLADYRRAIDVLLESAKRELCIFDSNLRELDFASRRRSERIASLLLAAPGNRVRIVLHDVGEVERFAPRLMTLLKQFSHCLEVRLTPPELRQLTECYVLADRDSGVVRFHAQHMRGKVFSGLPEEARAWHERFEELWNLAQPGISATTLGL